MVMVIQTKTIGMGLMKTIIVTNLKGVGIQE